MFLVSHFQKSPKNKKYITIPFIWHLADSYLWQEIAELLSFEVVVKFYSIWRFFSTPMGLPIYPITHKIKIYIAIPFIWYPFDHFVMINSLVREGFTKNGQIRDIVPTGGGSSQRPQCPNLLLRFFENIFKEFRMVWNIF